MMVMPTLSIQIRYPPAGLMLPVKLSFGLTTTTTSSSSSTTSRPSKHSKGMGCAWCAWGGRHLLVSALVTPVTLRLLVMRRLLLLVVLLVVVVQRFVY
jgi:glutathionyl-hydroquinone reductase